jgi:hypothetical protein
MLMACLSYTATTCCQLLIDEKMPSSEAKLGLKGASLIGAVILFAMVRKG